MDAATRAVLNETEKLLIAETDREALAALDEDAALELQTRMRRARDKYVGQYRRGASARVAEHGARGGGRPDATVSAPRRVRQRVAGERVMWATQNAGHLSALMRAKCPAFQVLTFLGKMRSCYAFESF